MQHDHLAIALDRASSRTYDQDGHLHVVSTPISKATVNPYYGREIPDWQALGLDANRIYNLLRDPVELAKAAETFNGKPLLSTHKPVTADDHAHDLTAGSVGNVIWADPYLRADLAVWDGEAIDDINREEKRQLSSGYRYRVDMTPGSFQGRAYDGVMRDITGNHVALVKEGRAGPDVMVGDSKLTPSAMKGLFLMSSTVLTRKAAMVQGALTAYLAPKLAADAKLDLAPPLAKIGADNFKAQKPAIAAAVRKLTKGKLAADEELSDVEKVLDMLDDLTPAEAEKVADKADDIAEGEGAAEDEKDDDEDDKKGKKKPAQDAKPSKDVVSKAAMDAALAKAKSDSDAAIAAAVRAAQDGAIRVQTEIREAEKFVRPWVGDLAIAQDSAEAVYKLALDTLKVDVAGVPGAAFKHILAAQPKPGDTPKPRTTPVAQDAAATKDYETRFPNANRLKA